MDSIAVVGVSTRGHDADALARFTLPRADRAGRLPGLAGALDASELVYLATCNRVEVLYRSASEPGADPRARLVAHLLGRAPEPGEAEAVRLWRGVDAVVHLFEVAAGLDSALVGEREIQGQLREALSAARQAGTSGTLVHHLVEEALRVARRIHLRTELGAGRVSLAEIAGELLLERVRRTPSPVALVGVTPMTRRVAGILRREEVDFLIVNRTLERATALVAELGTGSAVALAEFRLRPARVEAVLTATGAPGPVFDRPALERLAARTASLQPPLLVDLAVPPDVDPETARAVELPRIGMDEINGAAMARREGRRAETDAARRMIDDAIVELERRLAERALAPVIAAMHRRYRATALEGLDRLLARHGLELDGAARDDAERWAETLARRFAHLPTLGLRGLAANHGVAAVQAFLAACDEESEDLREAAARLAAIADGDEPGAGA